MFVYLLFFVIFPRIFFFKVASCPLWLSVFSLAVKLRKNVYEISKAIIFLIQCQSAEGK